MKLTQLLETVFKKAGVEATLADKLVSDPALALVEVADGVSDSVAKLITLDAAKNNVEVKNHYIGKFAAGVDSGLDDQLATLGLDLEEAREFLGGEKSTGKRANKLLEFVKKKAEEEAAASRKQPTDDRVKKLEESLARINTEKLALEKQLVQVKTDSAAEVEKVSTDYAVKSLVSGFKISDSIPATVRGQVVNETLKAAFAAKGLTAVVRDGHLKLLNADGLEYSVNGQVVTPSTFVEDTFKNAEILAPVAGPGSGSKGVATVESKFGPADQGGTLRPLAPLAEGVGGLSADIQALKALSQNGS